MRCDLSSVQQHVRVDHVHVEERCAQYKLVPSSTSGDSTLQSTSHLWLSQIELWSSKHMPDAAMGGQWCVRFTI